MKKKLALVLVGLLCFATVLTGCSAFSSGSSEKGDKEYAEMPKELQEIIDKGEFPVEGTGSSCKTTVKAAEKYKLAVIVKNNTNPACSGWMNGVEKACKDMGVECVKLTPSVNDSVEEQIKIIENEIQSGVNAIAIAPVDSDGILPGVRKADEAGIPVASMTTPCSDYEIAFVGPTFYDTGKAMGEKVAKQLNGKGNAIIIEGPAGAQNAVDRLQGVNDALKAYPDIKVVASQTGNFKRTEGMTVTENLIQKYTDVDAVIALNDEMGLGAVQALKAAGMKDTLVCGFDCNEDAANSIKNGELWASFNMDHFGIGYVTATALVMNLNYGYAPKDGRIVFPAADEKQIVTKDAVQDYMDNLAWYK